MKKIQDTAASFFIFCVILLSGISVLGVWNIFSDDVIWKSFQTIGLLAVVAIIVLVAGKFIGRNPHEQQLEEMYVPNPAFGAIRRGMIALLIILVTLFALVGALSIWELLEGEVVQKSLSSIALVAFGSLVVVITCLQREGKISRVAGVGGNTTQKTHPAVIVLFILFCLWFISVMVGGLFGGF